MDLEGKRLLVTVSDPAAGSALSAAALAQSLGAEVLLAARGGARTAGSAAAGELAEPCEVLELDVDRPHDREALTAELTSRWDRLDGMLHSLTYPLPGHPRPEESGVEMAGAERAFVTSAFSLSALTRAILPLTRSSSHPSASVVGLTFASTSAGPIPDRTGARGALEAVNRYLACELGPRGVRVNLVVGGDPGDATSVARAVCFLLSDWARAVTGEVLHLAPPAAMRAAGAEH